MEHKKAKGRPATGRTSKVIRVPLDFDQETANFLYYDVMPKLIQYRQECDNHPTSPRYDRLIKALEDLGF